MTDWSRAACRGNAELFFDHENTHSAVRRNAAIAKARAICSTCPIRVGCLDYALRMESRHSVEHTWGIWGGLTRYERHELQQVAEAV